MPEIVIVGAGTAGLTAAIYARRAAREVLILEALSYGGQIINTPEIENFPAAPGISGFDYATKLYEQAKSLGAEIRFEKVTGIRDLGEEKEILTAKNAYRARAVILATGSENRRLGLPDEEALTGRGVSYCATCDGAFFRGKKVAVAGGGNTALEDALYLADLCETVYLVHRRSEFRGEAANVAALRARTNVVFCLERTVSRLLADKRLTGVEIVGPQGQKEVLDVSGLFVAVGRVPENAPFASLIDLDEAGYAASGEDCLTRTPGVFVAGDNRRKAVRQLVTAAADGAVAATAAVQYLSGLN